MNWINELLSDDLDRVNKVVVNGEIPSHIVDEARKLYQAARDVSCGRENANHSRSCAAPYANYLDCLQIVAVNYTAGGE